MYGTRAVCSSRRPETRRGLTLVELLIVVIVIVILIAVLLPGMGHHGHGSRQMKDSSQVRGVVQALIVFMSSNQGRYPLPSQLDIGDQTVSEPGHTKDTTANILSLLVFNGGVSPEILINPAESNTDWVQRMDDYSYNTPGSAVNPVNALWDPAFRGTPEDPIRFWGQAVAGTKNKKPGNQSYAHLVPTGNRLKMWADTYSSTEAVFGDRGPTYAPDDFAPSPAGGKWKLPNGPLGTGSNTLLIHGGRNTWEGNIGYNDNHVNFETLPTPADVVYRGRGGAKTPDNLFVNESDEEKGDKKPWEFGVGLNAYLRPVAEMGIAGKARVWRD